MNSGRKILALAAAAALFGTCAAPAFAASDIVKDETVYVVTESDGTQSEVTVSDHLKNEAGADKIHDISNLTDIENVKGDESFEQNGGDELTWKAGGNDIYYQGTTGETVPVRLGISYFLNGDEVDGSALEGASGDVKIVINYRNEARSEDGTIIPFMALTGLIAEDDTFTDIEIDHGKVIDDGDKQVIVAMAAPGLKEALELDDDLIDLDLSDTVTIRGTANGFDSQDMMTIVTNSIFEEMDSDDFSDLDYDDQIRQLDKGAKALMSGTDLLYRGIDTMYESMPDLKKGVDALKDGADQLSEGTEEAKTGSGQLAAGIGQLAQELSEMDQTMKQMYEGVSGMESGTSRIKSNLETMRDGLSDGADELRDSADSIGSAAEDAESVAAYLDQLAPLLSSNEKAILEKVPESQRGKVKALIDGASKAQTGARQLSDGLKSAPEKIDGAADSIDEASEALGSYDASQGSDQKTIIGGLTVIDSGLNTLKEKIAAFSGGDSDLSALQKLVGGANSLAEGQVLLAGGAKQLAQGMTALQDNSRTLSGGVKQLDSGSLKLSQGMSKLYKDGIRKIVDLYNDDLKGNMDSMKDMIDAGRSYTTFTEVPEGMGGEVKFIYKTSIY